MPIPRNKPSRELARAHSRPGDPVFAAAYLGEGDVFDRSVARYADRGDCAAFMESVQDGRVPITELAWLGASPARSARVLRHRVGAT